MKQIAIYGKGGVETSTIYHAMLQRLRILIAIVEFLSVTNNTMSIDTKVPNYTCGVV